MIPNRVLAVLFALGSWTVLGIALWLRPDPRGFGTHESLGLPPCGFLVANGYPCMTCGMTTSFSNMAHLQPVAAFNANPMGIVLYLLTAAIALFMTRCAWSNADPLSPLRNRKAPYYIIVGSVLLLVNWGWLISKSTG